MGFSRTSYDFDAPEGEAAPVVALDMGGTSTDVSRFGGSLEHVFESTISGVTIVSPSVDTSTVAVGYILGF